MYAQYLNVMTLSIGTHDYVRNGNTRECLYPNVSRLKTHETLQGDSPSSKNTHITECEQFFSPLFYFYYFFFNYHLFIKFFFFFDYCKCILKDHVLNSYTYL